MSELRKPQYLSPSALGCFESNPDEYFMRYIVPKEIRPKKEPQTDAMSVGSAFDALVKNRLHRLFYGEQATIDAGYTIRHLVTNQCQEHNLPECLAIACHLFEEYIETGAYGDLVNTIQQSSVAPRMEFDVTATIGGVPLLGKPDLHFHSTLHAHVITDWKVSGSVSKSGVSPQQGYMLARDLRGSATNGKSHKKFSPTMHPGGIVVSELPMNETTDYWADQLTTYAWALGEEVGSQNFIARIEQIACRPHDTGLRAKHVTHQSTVSAAHQHRLLERYQECWEAVQTNHIWSDLSSAESRARGDLLIRSLASNPDAVKASTDDADTMDFSF